MCIFPGTILQERCKGRKKKREHRRFTRIRPKIQEFTEQKFGMFSLEQNNLGSDPNVAFQNDEDEWIENNYPLWPVEKSQRLNIQTDCARIERKDKENVITQNCWDLEHLTRKGNGS